MRIGHPWRYLYKNHSFCFFLWSVWHTHVLESDIYINDETEIIGKSSYGEAPSRIHFQQAWAIRHTPTMLLMFEQLASRGAQKDNFCYASSSVEVEEKCKVLYYVYLTLIHCWLTVVFTDGADYLFITIKRVDYEQWARQWWRRWWWWWKIWLFILHLCCNISCPVFPSSVAEQEL